MTIKASINAAFDIEGTIYTASFDIPGGTPSKDDPFEFKVTSKATGSEEEPQVLLEVLVPTPAGAYICVSPPMDVISKAGGGVVEDLSVVVGSKS